MMKLAEQIIVTNFVGMNSGFLLGWSPGGWRKDTGQNANSVHFRSECPPHG
jgi:hypothetical protein